MSDATDVKRELAELETALKRLEVEYNMYFAGRLPRPPWESRTRVAGMVKRLDRLRLANYAERFRLSTLQTRFQTFTDLWDRGLRAREEGRPGPFGRRTAAGRAAGDRKDQVVHVTAFQDPGREPDKLKELYDRLVEARRTAGEEAVPFQKFAALVRDQVQRFRQAGSPEVAFRVAVRDGKVNFTARGVKKGGEGGE